MPPNLGIIAGGGALPGHIARSAMAEGRKVFVLALDNQADPHVIDAFDHAWVRMGAAGEALKHFREHDIQEVVLAGPVERPGLRDLRPDGRALKFLSRGVFSRGDDGLLSALVTALEDEEGFRVLDVRDLVGGITAREGTLTLRGADEDRNTDIARGIDILRALGPSDVGQAVAVQDGVVLAVEAIEGTDAMVKRAGELRRSGPGPVLVKMSKPGQDHRVDLPTIGPATIEACRMAGFDGIALEAGMCLIVDEARVRADADAAGLFIEVCPTPRP